MDWISALLSAPPPDPPAGLRPWWSWLTLPVPGANTVQRAALGGHAADRLGLAFVAGYQEALTGLVPDRDPAELLGVAFTEQGGGHPRAIESRWTSDGDRWRLSGTKGWVTCGPLASAVIVVARVGTDAQGRPQLRAARVATDAPGVTITPHGPSPFVPEVPHAAIAFDRVAVPSLLPGDGYLGYLKAFRTLEDLHVHAALLGHLVGVGQQAGWPAETLEALLVPLLALDGLAGRDPLDPAGHRALGGVLAATTAVLETLAPRWATVDPEVRARWERDQPLLQVAGRARATRLARARG